MFEPTFRFFSVHFFFLPSLIQPQHPPPKLESDSAAVFLESLIFFACLLLSYILTNKSRTIFAKIQQKFVGECQRLSLSGERLKHFIKVANSTRYQSSSYTLLMNFFMRIKIYINTSVFVKNIYRICKKFFLI